MCMRNGIYILGRIWGVHLAAGAHVAGIRPSGTGVAWVSSAGLVMTGFFALGCHMDLCWSMGNQHGVADLVQDLDTEE